MTRVWLRATLRHCTRVLLLLLLTASARAAWVAWQRRAPTVQYTPVVLDDSATRNHRPGLPIDFEQLRGQLAPRMPSELSNVDSTSAAGSDNRPKKSRVYLVVNIAPDRSEVLINGVSRGNTPYVGEVGCQIGGKLTITVVPPKGLPKRFERDCDRTEIRIGD